MDIAKQYMKDQSKQNNIYCYILQNKLNDILC